MKISLSSCSALLAWIAMATSPAIAETRMQVSASSTPVYTKASGSAPQIGKVTSGEILFVSRIEGDWAAISPPDRLAVWLNKDFIEGNRVIAKSIQVRSGPGVQHDVVGTLVRGDPVMPRGEEGDWCKIAPPSSSTLWVKKSDLSEVLAHTTPIREVATAPKPAPLPPPTPTPAPTPPPAAPPASPPVAAPAPVPAAAPVMNPVAQSQPESPSAPPPAAPVRIAPSKPHAPPPQPAPRTVSAPSPVPAAPAPVVSAPVPPPPPAPPPSTPAPDTSLAQMLPPTPPPAATRSQPRPVAPQIAPPPPAATRPAPPPPPTLRPATALPAPAAPAVPATAAAPRSTETKAAPPPARRTSAMPAPSKAVPATASTVAAQKSKHVDVQVDTALVDELDLDEDLPNQGKGVQVEGELRNAPFMAASPSRYRLVGKDDDGMLEMVCHIHGDPSVLRSYVGKGISVRGREYWVVNSDMPVVVIGQIVPLAPENEPVVF